MHKQLSLLLTPAAQAHFCDLLSKELDSPSLNLRISVANPGTQRADVEITFCPAGAEEPNDLALQFAEFALYVEQASVVALCEAIIDYKTNQFGGQLSVKAPFIKGEPAPNKEATLHDRVQYILDSEINPNLAGHGGFVTLVEIRDNTKVMLRFGGGCHGCGMADVTLKSGIEKTLKQQCPDIVAVQDITDHACGEDPYYA